MSKILFNFILFSSLLYLSACKKPLPDPHLNDEIFLGLKQELASTEALLAERKNQLKEFQDKVVQADIQSSNLKVARAKADAALQEVRKLEQKVIYWKMKLLSREEIVRNLYLESFNKGEAWNNADEAMRYKKSINRNTKRKPASK